MIRPGMARLGLSAPLKKTRHRKSRSGLVEFGTARLGLSSLKKTSAVGYVLVRRNPVGCGMVWIILLLKLNNTRLGLVGLGSVWQGMDYFSLKFQQRLGRVRLGSAWRA